MANIAATAIEIREPDIATSTSTATTTITATATNTSSETTNKIYTAQSTLRRLLRPGILLPVLNSNYLLDSTQMMQLALVFFIRETGIIREKAN